MTEQELGHLESQLPGLPVGWECAVADLIDEVRRLRALNSELRAHRYDQLQRLSHVNIESNMRDAAQPAPAPGEGREE